MNFGVGSGLSLPTRDRIEKEEDSEQSKSRSFGFNINPPPSGDLSKPNNLGFNFEFGSTSSFGEDWLAINSEKLESSKRTSGFIDFSDSSPTPRKRPNNQLDNFEVSKRTDQSSNIVTKFSINDLKSDKKSALNIDQDTFKNFNDILSSAFEKVHQSECFQYFKQVDKTESQILSAVREIKEETISFIEKEEEVKERLREKVDVILDVLKKK